MNLLHEKQKSSPASDDALGKRTTETPLQSASPPSSPKYLHGWRLHLITIAFGNVAPLGSCFDTNQRPSLYLTLYLATVEVTIVSTALVTISDDLKAFSQNNWIVTAFLLTYTGNTQILLNLAVV